MSASFSSLVATNGSQKYNIPLVSDNTIADMKRAIGQAAGLPESLIPYLCITDSASLQRLGAPVTSKPARRRSARLQPVDSTDNESVLRALDFNCYTDGHGDKVCPSDKVFGHAKPDAIIVKSSVDGDITLLKKSGRALYADDTATCDALHIFAGRHLRVKFSAEVPPLMVNGRAFDMLSLTSTVADLQDACAAAFKVPIASQALLCDAFGHIYRIDNEDGGALTLSDLLSLRSENVEANAGMLTLMDLRTPEEAAKAASARSWSAHLKEPSLEVKFIQPSGSEVRVRVRPQDRVQDAFTRVCHKLRLRPTGYRLLFDGQRVDGRDCTFGELEAEEGDAFDINQEMMGGMMSVTSGMLGYAQLSKLSVPLDLCLLDGTSLTTLKVTAATTLGELRGLAKAKMLAAAEEANVDEMSEAEVRALAKSLQAAAKSKRRDEGAASSSSGAGPSKQPRKGD